MLSGDASHCKFRYDGVTSLCGRSSGFVYAFGLLLSWTTFYFHDYEAITTESHQGSVNIAEFDTYFRCSPKLNTIDMLFSVLTYPVQ